MGRKRKYFTENQKKEANKKCALEYYNDNIEKIRKKNLEKYYRNKVQMDTTGSFTMTKP